MILWRFVAIVIVIAIAACARGQTSEVPVGDEKKVCLTEKDVIAAYGQVCAVIGTYEVRPFENKKGGHWKDWHVVVLAEGNRPVLIESIWDDGKKHDDATIARYQGRRVEVVGKLHASPPADDRRANLVMPTVSPVDSIRVVE